MGKTLPGSLWHMETHRNMKRTKSDPSASALSQQNAEHGSRNINTYLRLPNRKSASSDRLPTIKKPSKRAATRGISAWGSSTLLLKWPFDETKRDVTSPITNINSSQIQTNGEMMGSMMDTYCQTESSSKDECFLPWKIDNIYHSLLWLEY